ncbi:RluA family pseudouridine synthase [Gramella jeungdoensis]|uniref:RluA family pseudouridine synthase n=1 Tax=Gramella jeungdoensis TaxID=708091 RepID=A0ABT0YZW8_9FLAO|nr:RluA family pseudouridine synthase [Gramella jeungdoensis]MCM8568693.1 RluA family pseudouridine synthase [Gramella jeungdoensis]
MKIIETHIVPAVSEKIRLQEYAVSIFTSIRTRSGIKKAIKKGLILINDRKAHTADWIKEGQKIDLLKQEVSAKKVFELKLEILFEDEDLAVVHKPPGYPTSGNYFKTIQNALPYNLKASTAPDALSLPLPAHRLDNPTSGILLCAKSRKALIGLQQDFKERRINKVYYALVNGEIPEPVEINSSIEDKTASTKVTPKEKFEIENKKYTLAEANPLTGRTHQIRIHLAKNGNPIVGDVEYGEEELGLFKGKTLYLFAVSISFQHPVTKESMHFEMSLPKKLRSLKRYRLP